MGGPLPEKEAKTILVQILQLGLAVLSSLSRE